MQETLLRVIRRVLRGALVLAALVLCAGVGYEQWSRRRVARDFPPDGRLIEHDGKLSHLNCTGEGSPTVILEAGAGRTGSRSWVLVQPLVAAKTRVCSYDRAGILWSEPRGGQRDANRIADELHELLNAASETPPYIMTGHSLGGLLVRVYAERFSGEVAGLVLVDSSHPEQWTRYPAEVIEARSRIRSSRPPPFAFRAWAASGLYRGLNWPLAQDAVDAFLPRSRPWGFYGEQAASDAISEQAAATGSLGDLPLVVLTAGVGARAPGLTEEVIEEVYETWLVFQAELAALSTNSEHHTIEGAAHNIHRDDPDAGSRGDSPRRRQGTSGDLIAKIGVTTG